MVTKTHILISPPLLPTSSLFICGCCWLYYYFMRFDTGSKLVKSVPVCKSMVSKTLEFWIPLLYCQLLGSLYVAAVGCSIILRGLSWWYPRTIHRSRWGHKSRKKKRQLSLKRHQCIKTGLEMKRYLKVGTIWFPSCIVHYSILKMLCFCKYFDQSERRTTLVLCRQSPLNLHNFCLTRGFK